MVMTVAKNLASGASETIHVVAFTPAARLVPVELAPAGEQTVLVGELAKSATRYVFKPKPGPWLSLVASALDRTDEPALARLTRGIGHACYAIVHCLRR
jgi:hypothetical protein